MAKTLGREATVEVSPDGTTWTAVSRHFDGEIDHGEEDVDSHTNDDAGFKDYERCWQQISFSFRYYPEVSEAVHLTLVDARRDNTNLHWRVREKGSAATATGKPELRFRGVPVLKKSTPRDNLHTISCSVRSKGAVTDTEQA